MEGSFVNVPIGEESASPRSLPREPEALDREIRRLCAELAKRDLALGVVAESARKAEVWRRLGFATEAQYGRMPELGEAIAKGRIGYEAAYLLSRVATPDTVSEWIGRAECRH